jgi:hypothetical protein
MNERIKKLIEQSKNNAIKEFGDRTFQWDDFYLRRDEILSELIIQECVTICEDVAERNDPAIACYYDIKQHFGVE